MKAPILTEENFEIIKMLGEGLTVKEVASKISLKCRTVEKRIKKMRQDYNCSTVTQLVVTALAVECARRAAISQKINA